jgi:hypothetical protein
MLSQGPFRLDSYSLSCNRLIVKDSCVLLLQKLLIQVSVIPIL